MIFVVYFELVESGKIITEEAITVPIVMAVLGIHPLPGVEPVLFLSAMRHSFQIHSSSMQSISLL